MEDVASEETGGFGSLGSAVGLLALAWGAIIASFPLNDNSFFTHLATGRIILDERAVPSTDPYTFTAAGEDWTVQSWLASVAYAGAEQLGGAVGLRILLLAVFVVAAALVWRLSRPAESIVVRLVIVSAALMVGTGLWGERPYMIGVIGLGVVWLALEGSVKPWLLVPLLWVWANSHGSFPLATGLIVLVLAGAALDLRKAGSEDSRPPLRESLRTELSVLKATLAGTVLAVIGPLGIDVLLFPVKSITQSGALGEIIEWQPPGYRSVSERAFLVLAFATFAGLVRCGRWRLAIPALIFGGSAVFAQRNVVMATMVLVPVLASSVPPLGTLTARTRPGLGTAFTGICAAAAALAAVVAVSGPAVDLSGYPVNALAWLDDRPSSETLGRVATQDRPGNLLEVLDGPGRSVFIDDRADMFPAAVFDDHVDLARGNPGWSTVLDRYDIDLVVWSRTAPLGSILAADGAWRMAFADTSWAVFCRRGPACEPLLG